jgi:trehalose synthase
MATVSEVPIAPASPDRFRALLGENFAAVEAAVADVRGVLEGRVIWHVNSTARGGGVAEMLQSLLAYARGAGADVRWHTIEGNEDFFRLTKRLHNNLHGAPGDGGELGKDERDVYEHVLSQNGAELTSLINRGDLVYLHDPQTAGMADLMRSAGARVVWRCHIGIDEPNELARRAWGFLLPYLEDADAYVFSRRAFVWEGMDESRLWIVPPSIDAFSPKNQEMEPGVAAAIMAKLGLAEDGGTVPVFERTDGSHSRVDRGAELDQEGKIPRDVPLLCQVSRWDRLKDPVGVMRCFATHRSRPEAHLLLAGPSVADVADDPEGAEVLGEVRAALAELPAAVRARTHLACLPMDDVEENAAMVNAIQRRADLILQKSLAEGFGLTVAEAMWKGKPVVASRLGGIQDQIVDGESGVLVDDPTDLDSVARACDSLLADPDRAEEIGAAARERVRTEFLNTRHLIQYLRLIEQMLRDGRPDGR